MYDFSEMTAWLVAVLSIWSIQSLVVRQFIQVVKPAYDNLWSYVVSLPINKLLAMAGFGQVNLRTLRNLSIPALLFAAAYASVQSSGYDVLVGAPRLLASIDPSYHVWITALWLTAGAVLLHEGLTWYNDQEPAAG